MTNQAGNKEVGAEQAPVTTPSAATSGVVSSMVIAGSGGGVRLNEALSPEPSNPHSWLVLVGDPPPAPGRRVMTGILRPTYRDHVNTAVAFGRAKLQPVKPRPDQNAWTPTAYASEVLLPTGADDRLGCPRRLLEEIDDALVPCAKAILAYITITPAPGSGRAHEQRETVRAWAMAELVDRFHVPVLLVQHIPALNAGSARPHLHLVAAVRSLAADPGGWAGFGATVPLLCGDRLRAHVIGTLPAYEKRRGDRVA